MQEMEIIEIFTRSGAYKQGHFKLSSSLHSGVYLQCALIFQDPAVSVRICGALAEKFRADEPDVVIGPALGGIIFAYEMARALGARAMFTERNDEGKMVLRRGFIVSPKNRVLLVEDVLTTGKSVKEVIDLLKKDGVTPVGIASVVDRSLKKADFGGVKYESLIKFNIPVFEEKDCPLCKEGLPVMKPGSRKK